MVGPNGGTKNPEMHLGPRMIMTGARVLGTGDDIVIEVTEATEEELEVIKGALEVRLVKQRRGYDLPGAL